MLSYNPILDSDGYKLSHWLQYPAGMTKAFSYVESRGGRWPLSVFFGPQIFLKKLAETPITHDHISEAAELSIPYGVPMNVSGWRDIVDRLGGRLPLSIRAVPEGTVLPTGNVLMTVENTDDAFPWLPSYIETAMLRAAWYGTTVATNSFYVKRAIKPFLDATSDDPELEIWSRLHDFGARAATSQQQAEIGGAAHLVNFTGTDTLDGIRAAMRYYGAGMSPGQSIPAAEHSTITSWGRANELLAYRNMIAQYGVGAYSVVSDSYDLWNAVGHLWGEKLRDDVVEAGGMLVVRPDSGDPVETPIQVVLRLAQKFGTTHNTKGFRVLNNVRVIQGDGIGIDEVKRILSELRRLGFSASNIVFGMGGKLLQADLNRDTMKFAQKLSGAEIDGTWIDVFKDPVDDAGKRSKPGRLALVRDGVSFTTVPLVGNEERNQLVEVFRNGETMNEASFADVRGRAALAL